MKSDDIADLSGPTSEYTHLAFHKVTDHISFGVSNFSPRRFFGFVASLSKDEINKLRFTFDDGYRHLYDILLKLLTITDTKPILFIPTNYIGKPNSWDYSYWFRKEMHLSNSEIKELAKRGVRFGSHTHSHMNLTSLSKDKIIEELKLSKEILEDLTETEINCLSYPFGQTNPDITALLRETGYKKAFTMKFPESTDDSLTIGRIPVYTFDTRFTLMQKINRGRLYQIEKLKSAITSRLSLGTAILQKVKGE